MDQLANQISTPLPHGLCTNHNEDTNSKPPNSVRGAALPHSQMKRLRFRVVSEWQSPVGFTLLLLQSWLGTMTRPHCLGPSPPSGGLWLEVHYQPLAGPGRLFFTLSPQQPLDPNPSLVPPSSYSRTEPGRYPLRDGSKGRNSGKASRGDGCGADPSTQVSTTLAPRALEMLQ